MFLAACFLLSTHYDFKITSTPKFSGCFIIMLFAFLIFIQLTYYTIYSKFIVTCKHVLKQFIWTVLHLFFLLFITGHLSVSYVYVMTRITLRKISFFFSLLFIFFQINIRGTLLATFRIQS